MRTETMKKSPTGLLLQRHCWRRPQSAQKALPQDWQEPQTLGTALELRQVLQQLLQQLQFDQTQWKLQRQLTGLQLLLADQTLERLAMVLM